MTKSHEYYFSAFGFCEFGNPDAALRAIRLLHDYEIAEKKLVVKADAKTKEVLDDYKGKSAVFCSKKYNCGYLIICSD